MNATVDQVIDAICRYINPDAIAMRLIDSTDCDNPNGIMIATVGRFVELDRHGNVFKSSHPAKGLPSG
jgi:hypothetical protein